MATIITEQKKIFETKRNDFWWIEPAAVAIGLILFIIYASWAALQGKHYEWGPYMSPFYSPVITVHWWKFSPVFLVIWVPAGFRFTCYYFRRAYYRAYFMDPPACAVSEYCKKYKGENSFPFILQNLHRYFLYFATFLIFFHWHDAYHSFNFDGQFGIGVGSLVLLADVILLSLYIISCHACRHLIGGCLDSFKLKTHHNFYLLISKLNERHMFWAWSSLFMVGFADFYVRMLSMGIWTDVRFL